MTEIGQTEFAGYAIGLTEVTLRDGMQQDNITQGEPTPISDRISVFDSLVVAGMQRIEIGHLGNEDGLDVAFASALVDHITAAEAAGDTRYEGVELQVLFGSQQELIDKGVKALDGFDKERVIVHVYDRLSPGLRDLATESYTSQMSAQRVIDATQIAIDHGFTRFSISGEGAIDPKADVDEAVEFYTTISDAIHERGAEEVNVNLANTFGFSASEETFGELYHFNREVKRDRDFVTTSVHVHNDYNSAPHYALTAIKAGFDRVEGTMIGMGERAGNVALADVVVRLLEHARAEVDKAEYGTARRFLGLSAVRESIWKQRYLEPSVLNALGSFYETCVSIADTFGTHNRFGKTSLGNPEAYDAGSGPHAHANREFLKDPVRKPLWESYGAVALIHAALGNPKALGIIGVDVDQIKKITLITHATMGSRSTKDVLNDDVEIAPIEERKESEAMARTKIAAITEHVSPKPKNQVASGDSDIRDFYAGIIQRSDDDSWMSPSRRSTLGVQSQ